MPSAKVGDETEAPAHKRSIVSWTRKAIQESPLINDPISAVVVGMLATVVLQSATTTTNILVTMVAANMITVHDAIPVMIGSELGSSLVNAMVSLAYSGKPEQFKRAFSAAILGDVFNICGLFVIFPMEMFTGLIEKVSWWIVDPLISEQGLSFKTLELLTDPINQIILQKLLEGHAANYVKSLLSKQCPGMWKPCTGYLVMLVGLIVTILIQSNSIFSSSLTPLVGSGVVTLEQMYPLVLGSNIGTTFSGVLAAFSTDPSRFEKALHMAMCQVIYNIIGTCLFYIVPCTRKFPVYLSLKLGEITNEYRWFIVVFIFTFFLIIPFTIIGLTLLPDNVIVVVFIVLLILAIICCLICVIQNSCVEFLPRFLQDWKFLPIWMRSLEYYDPFMTKVFTRLPYIGGFFRNGGSYRRRFEQDGKAHKTDDIEHKVHKLVQLSGHSQV
uniref:Uncharacterized protein n=1 Tax=Caenorhabditis japonica TaxID=281687 RepID=A0A8R1I1R5_CAEJA